MIIWTTNEADYPDHSFLYVSKLGNDSNAGTKAAPLLTINAAIAIAEADAGYITELIAIVVGEGVWGEELSNTRVKAYKFIGNEIPIYNMGSHNFNFKVNEHLVNGELINQPSTRLNNTLSLSLHLKNVKAEYIYLHQYTNAVFDLQCYMENCVINEFFLHKQSSANCTLRVGAINCTFERLRLKYNVQIGSELNIAITDVYNNIITDYIQLPGTIIRSGFTFDYNNFVKNKAFVGLGDGTEVDALSSVSIVTSTTNQNSISAEPEFSNEALGDYSLKETSPCLLAGLNRATIGAYNRGWPHYSFTDIFRGIFGAVYSESYVGVTLERDIVTELELGEFELEGGHHTGTVISAIGTLGTPQRIDKIESLIDFGADVNGYHTNLPVWSDFLFSAYNNARKYFEGDTITEGGVKYICILDYPNESPFVEYPPASSATYWAVSTIPTSTNVVPNFLFRHGNSLAEVNAAAWKLMPFKGDFMVDTAGKGSADPDYDAATGRYITFSRYQFKLKLKNL